ncbi:hypothetical protein SISNIDRAFT_466473 [Sistotremastrum niveocremeum HHB9708]|uniref:Uncharacterized protein n=1 Tax=Sistotremastrum niveocremeum HHB9708 TaxID=1314777 RepID=A0A164UDW9_9AGAM|nr:hypothetical protein SISNIDRAFT_466473 [Sistotremastrum niveocremeum HHB9708]
MSDDPDFRLPYPDRTLRLLSRDQGMCCAVLHGGRGASHEGAVLHTDFHPSLPLIASCGLDRRVKIWRVPSVRHTVEAEYGYGCQKTLHKDDRPLFTSTLMHSSQIVRVKWLSRDILLTQAAPSLLPSPFQAYGSVMVWRWLALDRFLPLIESPARWREARGCISDYKDSCA